MESPGSARLEAHLTPADLLPPHHRGGARRCGQLTPLYPPFCCVRRRRAAR